MKTIEIGWVINGTQVRSQKGGGTRKIKCEVNLIMNDIVPKALELFFPGGRSLHHGDSSSYHFSIVNFDLTNIHFDATVQDLYMICIRLNQY